MNRIAQEKESEDFDTLIKSNPDAAYGLLVEYVVRSQNFGIKCSDGSVISSQMDGAAAEAYFERLHPQFTGESLVICIEVVSIIGSKILLLHLERA